MTELNPWLRCALAILAVWRVTHLLAAEDGPGDLLVRLHRRLHVSWAGRLMDCFYCLSLWAAVPLACWVATGPLDIAVAWLAVSGGACLLERLTEAPVVIESVRGDAHGMLRPEPRENRERSNVADKKRA
jgi:hypothetical protein